MNKKRRVPDAEGRAIAEVKGLMGRWQLDADVKRIRELACDQLEVAETQRMLRPRFPHGEAESASAKPIEQRSSLDHLRVLGEEIKRRKAREDSGK